MSLFRFDVSRSWLRHSSIRAFSELPIGAPDEAGYGGVCGRTGRFRQSLNGLTSQGVVKATGRNEFTCDAVLPRLHQAERLDCSTQTGRCF